MLKFDEVNLRDVAEVLIKINPSLDGFYTQHVMYRMRANAEKCYAAEGNNGGTWATHYTDSQKDLWRARAQKLIEDLKMELTPAL